MTKLYNYMPYNRLMSWLTNGIYFGVASKFDDPCEGHQNDHTVRALAHGIRDTAISLGSDSEAMGKLSDNFVSITHGFARAAKRQTFISCWHSNTAFSPRMSATYGDGGVYIRTNPDRILLSLRKSSPGPSQLLKPAPGTGGDVFHQVRYIDNIDNPEALKALNDLLALSFHGNKRTVWEYQREWRMVIDAADVTVRTGIEINGTQALSRGAEGLEIDPTGLLVVRNADDETTHLYLKADPSLLIDEIGVADPALLDDVATLCCHFGLPTPRLVTPGERVIVEAEEECPDIGHPASKNTG